MKHEAKILDNTRFQCMAGSSFEEEEALACMYVFITLFYH